MGPLGALLGALGGLLEVSWGLLGPALGSPRFLFPKGSQISKTRGGVWGPKRVPKRTQNRVQDGPKSMTKSNIKKYLFRTVLGASCGDLGAFSVPSKGHRMHSPCSGARFLKNPYFFEKSCLGPIFGQLDHPKGPKGSPKWSPKGSQNESKTMLKT